MPIESGVQHRLEKKAAELAAFGFMEADFFL